jgi:hypothetical protein
LKQQQQQHLLQQQQQQQQQLQPLTPDEYRAYRRILYVNKTTLDKATVNDFKSSFYDISTGITYPAIHNLNYLKQIFFNLKKKGYIIPSLIRTRPQGYYAKEYEHLNHSLLLTNDMTYIPSTTQNTNYSSPRDIGELLQFGIHDILFCPHVKGSHQQFIDYGLKENIKKNIKVATFNINSLKFVVRSSNLDTIMIHVATSRNQIMLNSPSHLDLLDQSLDKLIDILSHTYGIDNIPYHDNWIIKLWHYAADYNNASGEKFHVTWRDAKGIFNRTYSKIIPSQSTNTRYEVQEVPNLNKKLALQSKLGSSSLTNALKANNDRRSSTTVSAGNNANSEAV